VSTIVVPTVNSIAVDNRRPLECMAAFLVALGYQLRMATRTVSDFMERRFAEYAGVPHPDSLGRQQWEELWETEAETLTAADRDSSSHKGNAIRV
jgi:hypothetical protein